MNFKFANVIFQLVARMVLIAAALTVSAYMTAAMEGYSKCLVEQPVSPTEAK